MLHMRKTPAPHIEVSPDIAGGKPCLAGTRIRIQDIVAWTELGRSPDDISNMYPHVTLADVHAALAYYHDNRAEIDRQMREDDEFVDRFKAEYLTGSGRDADDNPLPSG
jgi:uncharacterized protein (DUF433 family)